MKFRAKLDDVASIMRLSTVVATLAKNVKLCILRLCTDKVCFVISDRGSLSMWCELNQSTFFKEYCVEGRNDRNQIYLELHMEQLSRALRHTHNAISVKIKLIKSNGAYLTIDVVQPTVTGNTRNVVHEVPVSVLPQRIWADYQDPHMPDIDVSIYLPPLKQMKTIIDRMKSLDNYIKVSANMNGQLQLQLETDTVTATTYFKDLQNHQIFDMDHSIKDSSIMYEARVDIRKLSHILTGHFNPIKAICSKPNIALLHCLLLARYCGWVWPSIFPVASRCIITVLHPSYILLT